MANLDPDNRTLALQIQQNSIRRSTYIYHKWKIPRDKVGRAECKAVPRLSEAYIYLRSCHVHTRTHIWTPLFNEKARQLGTRPVPVQWSPLEVAIKPMAIEAIRLPPPNSCWRLVNLGTLISNSHCFSSSSSPWAASSSIVVTKCRYGCFRYKWQNTVFLIDSNSRRQEGSIREKYYRLQVDGKRIATAPKETSASATIRRKCTSVYLTWSRP